ncbi:DUF4190 domain-containing protein [Streptomyces sp. APSN-46.1]|uniref:DUF4190 domain-containing protein n=1 Tax=Streptomyces sp. APSN-46.1 TaxID=2929049 RepID=UPI001FB3AE6F|nr:DUF4190 domain-containing protein [Streptomyces sp. APSN-46.1]MCJ1677642.1 DUF4190 domain-containing protein [Streptomyces sp. APSN-46.1]
MSIPPQPPSSPGPYPQSGPYGQPGQPGPYGGPQGWYAPQQTPLSQKTNSLAIVAFVMSILCGLPMVPLILGIVALSQIRDRGEKGKGLAIAAIVIHVATIAFYALMLILGLSGALDDGPSPKRDTSGQVTSPGSSDVKDIRKGDCFNTDDDLAEYDEKEGGQAFSVRIVPCDQAHEGEAYAVFDVEDGPYPGAEKVVSIAEEKCAGTALTDYVGDAAKLPQTLEVFYYHPQSVSWAFGDREVTCFLGDTSGGSSTGSVRATGS